MKKRKFLIFISFFCTIQMIGQSLDGWLLKKDKNNIQIFIKTDKKSNVLSYKIFATVDAPVSDVAALLYDVESYPVWTPSLKTADILSRLNKDEMFYYVDVNAPWPLSNRDNIIHFQKHKDQVSNAVEIIVTGVPDYISEVRGVVRVTQSKGIWKLTPKEKNKTEVLSIHSSDPSGNIPVWIVKIFIVNNIYNIFKNLKEEVKKDKYQGFNPQGMEIQL